MKKIYFLLAMLLITMHVGAQNFSGLDVSPMDAVSYPMNHNTSEKIVKIIYSRPQLKERDVAALAKPGEVWRMGANEATEVRLYEDVMFGDTKIHSGTYSLFAIPGEEEWIVILNSDIDVWGAYSYNPDKDVVRVKAKVSKYTETIEAFTIVFDDEMNLYLAWGNDVITVPMKEL